jgi:hypothetical protein
MSKVAEHECTPESLPSGARHIGVARYGDLTCRDGIAAVESAEAEAEAEVEVEAEADGGPSSVDDIGRLEPVWTGGTLDPQCSKEKEEGGEFVKSKQNADTTLALHAPRTNPSSLPLPRPPPPPQDPSAPPLPPWPCVIPPCVISSRVKSLPPWRARSLPNTSPPFLCSLSYSCRTM